MTALRSRVLPVTVTGRTEPTENLKEVRSGGSVLGYRGKPGAERPTLSPREGLTLRIRADIDRLRRWRQDEGVIDDPAVVLEAYRQSLGEGRFAPSGKEIGRILNVHLVEVVCASLRYIHAIDEPEAARKSRQKAAKRAADLARKRRQREADGTGWGETAAAKAAAAGVSRATYYRHLKAEKCRETKSSHAGETGLSPVPLLYDERQNRLTLALEREQHLRSRQPKGGT